MSSRGRVPSPLSACFYPTAAVDDPPPPPSPISGDPNATTSLYQTHLGIFSLTWSRSSFLTHSLHLQISLNSNHNSQSNLSFRLHMKPFAFWRKQGSKKLQKEPRIKVYWDLTRVQFGSGSGSGPQSGFYVAVVVDGEMGLLVGDCSDEAYRKTKIPKQRTKRQNLVLRRENVFGNRDYVTKAWIRGVLREIKINCRVNEDDKLRFSIDGEKVLEIKRLKWKFRGNQKIEIDGTTIHVSWDVHNWLFGHKDKDKTGNDYAVFMFRFEDQEAEGLNGGVSWPKKKNLNDVGLWQQNSRASSSSFSSVSSGCSPTLMEWASCTDESEISFGQNIGSSLVVYAWKK